MAAGFARPRPAEAARHYALAAESCRERVLRLVAVARAQAADGRAGSAVLTLARARQEMTDGNLVRALESQVMSDTAVILAGIGDFEGARRANERVASAALRSHLRRYIAAAERFWPR